MVNDSREALRLGISELRVGSRERDRADSFQVDAVVDAIKPNQGLSFAGGPIFPGMHLNRFVGLILGRLLQGILDVVARIDMVTILPELYGRATASEAKDR